MLSKYEARRYAKSLLREKCAELKAKAEQSKDYPFKERQEKFIAYCEIVIEELGK